MSVRTSPLKRNRLSAALLATMVIPSLAFAQSNSTAQGAEQESKSNATTSLDKVQVTGSRIKRAEIEGPAPVTVITAEEIEKSGYNTVYEVLNTLTQNTGDVDNELNPGSWTPNGAFINLRAMGPGYTLVLLNGRRMAEYPLAYRGAGSGGVSISNIPSSAIARIETLAGGASAIYGSDAVAGVINIVTKENYEGDEISIRGGTTTEGGGDNVTLAWVGGKSGDKWSVTYGADYFAREPLLGIQRDFMDSYYDDPTVDPAYANAPATGIRAYRYAASATRPGLPGVPATANYWVDANGNLVPTSAAAGSIASGAGLAALQYNCGLFGDFETYNTSATILNTSPNACGFFSQPATQTIQSKYDRASAFASLTYDFDNGMQWYGQFMASQLNSMTASGTRFLQPSGGYSTSPLGLIYHLRYLTLEELGSPQQILHEEKSYNFATGLRGTVFNDRFDWDFGVAMGGMDYEGRQPWLLTGPFYDYFFGGQPQTAPAGTYNAYSYFPNYNEAYLKRWLTPITPEIYRTFADDLVNTGESMSQQASFTFSGDLFELPAGPLGFAGVLEWGHQEYEQRPDIRTTTDYTGYDKAMGLTSTRGSGERDRYAVGMEFSVPIFSKLKASLAARYDDIDMMAEGATTWTAGLEFRPFSNLLLRGNYATSYRAPDMQYVFAEESGGYSTITDYYRCRRDGLTPTSGTGNPCSSSSGNPNYQDYYYQILSYREGTPELKAEEGKSFTAGFVWDIIDNMSLSMDYYSIELEGKVSFLDTSYLLRNEANCRLGVTEEGQPFDSNSAMCADFLSFVERVAEDPEAPGTPGRITTFWTYPYNQALTKTSGVDTAWNYRYDGGGWGQWNFRLAHTIVLELEDQAYPGGEVLDRRHHRQYFDYRSRASWSAGWSKDSWSAQLSGYRLGSLPNWAEDDRVGSYVTWSGSVTKQITDSVSASLSATNLFNNRAPEDKTYNTYPYFWRGYGNGAIGRTVAATIKFKF